MQKQDRRIGDVHAFLAVSAFGILGLTMLVSFLSWAHQSQPQASSVQPTVLTLRQLNIAKPYHLLGNLLVEYNGLHLPNPVHVSGFLLATGTLEVVSDGDQRYEVELLEVGDRGATAFIEQTTARPRRSELGFPKRPGGASLKH